MFWRTHDTSDRQGITEIHHVTGYLAFWDELRRRHPNLLIDSCASGGRRNDLETMRRAVPFLRSDFLFEPVSQQAHFYGVSFWLPHHGTGTIVGPSKLLKELKTGEVNTYMFRSHMSPTVIACWDMRRDDLDYAKLRELCRQLRQIQPYYYGDYYPLTPHSLVNNVWMAWQFDRPDLNAGIVQAFRRAESPLTTMRLMLYGLDQDADYEVENLEGGKKTLTGLKLMREGLSVTLNDKPQAAVFVYQRINNKSLIKERNLPIADMNSIPSEFFGVTKKTTQIEAFLPSPHFDRHDPSNIIQHGGCLWVFYTMNVSNHREVSVHFASSVDGYQWTDLGEAFGPAMMAIGM